MNDAANKPGLLVLGAYPEEELGALARHFTVHRLAEAAITYGPSSGTMVHLPDRSARRVARSGAEVPRLPRPRLPALDLVEPQAGGLARAHHDGEIVEVVEQGAVVMARLVKLEELR